MSEERAEHPPQEEDRLRAGPVLLLVAAALVMIAVGILWPWAMLVVHGDWHPLALADQPRRAHPVPAWAAGMRQSLIDEQARSGEARREQQEEQDTLDDFGWVDRRHGLVRIPIDDAIALWLERRTGSDATETDR